MLIDECGMWGAAREENRLDTKVMIWSGAGRGKVEGRSEKGLVWVG